MPPDPRTAGPRLIEAERKMKAGQLAEGVTDLEGIYADWPHGPPASRCLFLLALAAYQVKDRARAIRFMRGAIGEGDTITKELSARGHFNGATRRKVQESQANAYYNLGCFVHEEGETAEAKRCYETALQLDPANSQSLGNLGNVHLEEGNTAEAIRCYEKVTRLGGITAREAIYNRGLARLLIGDYARGWPDYEERHEMPMWLQEYARKELTPQHRWRGKPIPGKRLLLTAEQGFGDTIMMVRFRDAVAARSQAELTWEVQPQLLSLLRANLPDQVIARGAPLPEHDAWLSLMSLPFVCGLKRPADIPPAPYLKAA